MRTIFLPALLGAALFASVACDNKADEPPPKKDPSTMAKPSADKPAATASTSATASATATAEPTASAATSASAATPADAGKATTTATADAGKPAAAKNPALLDPSKATEKAPATYRAKFDTSKGVFTVKVTRDWAPLGADRFYNLVKIGFYNDCRFFRVAKDFVVQWGINGDPVVSPKWKEAMIQDEPVKQGNKKGFITFAKGGPNSRTTQVFINFSDNSRLDAMGFPAFGEVEGDGMKILESLYNAYGEQPTGTQGEIQSEGNAFLAKRFPELDWIKEATIVK